jgi:hypothetical protein
LTSFGPCFAHLAIREQQYTLVRFRVYSFLWAKIKKSSIHTNRYFKTTQAISEAFLQDQRSLNCRAQEQ